MSRVALTTVLLAVAALLAPSAVAADASDRAPAEAALTALSADHPATRATWRDGDATPWIVSGMRVPTPDAPTADARATAFLKAWPALHGVDVATLELDEVRTMKGRSIVRLQQLHDGLPVLGRKVVVNLDDAGRAFMLVNGAARIGTLPPARLDVADAKIVALEAAGFGEELISLAVLAKVPAREAILAEGGVAKRVWEVQVVRQPLVAHLKVLVDAATGDVLSLTNEVLR